jgi:hypothetical protein
MMKIYEHVQRGKLLWLAVVFIAIEAVVLAFVGDELQGPALIITLGAVGLIVMTITVASTLTVAVTTTEVILSFGWGWPRKRISRSDIVSHSPVRNHWLLGWGIRWFPGGSMWNVWGRDAIELEMTSGRKFRIGTNDTDGLTLALNSR